MKKSIICWQFVNELYKVEIVGHWKAFKIRRTRKHVIVYLAELDENQDAES